MVSTRKIGRVGHWGGRGVLIMGEKRNDTTTLIIINEGKISKGRAREERKTGREEESLERLDR